MRLTMRTAGRMWKKSARRKPWNTVTQWIILVSVRKTRTQKCGQGWRAGSARKNAALYGFVWLAFYIYDQMLHKCSELLSLFSGMQNRVLYHTAQAGLKLNAALLPQPPNSGIIRCEAPHPAVFFFLAQEFLQDYSAPMLWYTYWNSV